MQIKHPFPDSPRAWLEEIARAYKDARETIPLAFWRIVLSRS